MGENVGVRGMRSRGIVAVDAYWFGILVEVLAVAFVGTSIVSYSILEHHFQILINKISHDLILHHTSTK